MCLDERVSGLDLSSIGFNRLQATSIGFDRRIGVTPPGERVAFSLKPPAKSAG
jgi:hypothetical protein